VKEALEEVVSGWEPLGHCGNKCQYLEDLSMNKNMTHLKHQVEAILHPVVKSMVTSRYKSLTKIKVGAIRSRGDTSQEELMGSMHRDYHDEVNRRVPNERPQSIIFAVDPFNFIYDQNSEWEVTSTQTTSGQSLNRRNAGFTIQATAMNIVSLQQFDQEGILC